MRFLGIFRRRSGRIAKERLSQVLAADRATCSLNTLSHIKKDMQDVLYKYVEVESEAIDCRISKVKDDKDVEKQVLVMILPFKKQVN